ncbi:hypothetical protein D9758_005821 [Tetrapyrgos nigripes]|uniref:Uncharacterized protein n=1 Tax=Tetrapyrgos nigripes TaxID=182062 RepID=A0A8H5LQG1_9AGAR|nr:hypothetical protein D9758_005821 [Tetrapyrgos nigripes]
MSNPTNFQEKDQDFQPDPGLENWNDDIHGDLEDQFLPDNLMPTDLSIPRESHPDIDDIKTEFHPQTQKPVVIEPFEEFGFTPLADSEMPTDFEPWKPFRTRLDYEVSEFTKGLLMILLIYLASYHLSRPMTHIPISMDILTVNHSFVHFVSAPYSYYAV